jgi:hypothetical protein
MTTRSRTGRPAANGLAMKVCLYFAANPESKLTTGVIATKFAREFNGINTLLKPALSAGLLEREMGGGQKQTIYRAGPALLHAIQPEPDCEPEISQVVRPAGTWEGLGSILKGGPFDWLVPA